MAEKESVFEINEPEPLRRKVGRTVVHLLRRLAEETGPQPGRDYSKHYEDWWNERR